MAMLLQLVFDTAKVVNFFVENTLGNHSASSANAVTFTNMAQKRLKQLGLAGILVLFIFSGLHGQTCKEVVGYFASWKWYKRDKLVNPVSIDYSKYSVINYAFFKPLPSGAIVSGDTWADQTILLGKERDQNGVTKRDAATSLPANAHKNNVKVVASVGGWSWSSAFPVLASNAQTRKQFAESCIDLIREYDLDGIDIDWEFPGNKLHNGTANDKTNFTLLLISIREALNEYGSQNGKNLLLTAAFGPAPDHLDKIDWERVEPLLDMIHVMTYNYYGPWDKITNHNTPLYPGAKGNSAFAISSSIERLTKIHHVPASKITMGIAFYGRTAIMQNNSALYALSTGTADNINFKEENGTPSYYSIVAKAGLFNRQWDDKAGVPYLTGKAGVNSFVSYDDVESVKLKAAYAMKMQLLGAVIWDISGDYLETFPGSRKISGTPLADALHETFCSESGRSVQPEAVCGVDMLVFPNPFRDEVDIKWNSDCAIVKIVVRNQSGQIVYVNEKIADGNLKLQSSGWTPGWYVIQLISASGVTGQKVLKM